LERSQDVRDGQYHQQQNGNPGSYAAGGPVRGYVSGFSPLSAPGNLPQHPQQLLFCHAGQGPVRGGSIRNIPATLEKRAGDFVAQREFIRITPATPEALPLLECCGVADVAAISRSARRWELDFTRATPRPRFKTSRQASLLNFVAFAAPSR